MFKKLRQFFIRRKNKSSKRKYFSPPPSAIYRKTSEFPFDSELLMQTPPKRLSTISIEDCSHLFENQFQLSRIPTLHSSGWQSSKPYSQNASRFKFYGSHNKFRSSKRSVSSQGSAPPTPKSSKSTTKKNHNCHSTPRRPVRHQPPNRLKFEVLPKFGGSQAKYDENTEFNQNLYHLDQYQSQDLNNPYAQQFQHSYRNFEMAPYSYYYRDHAHYQSQKLNQSIPNFGFSG